MDHGFKLVLEKSKVVIFTKNRIPTLRPILIGKTIIESKSMPNLKIGFLEQIEAAADKAAVGVTTLRWLMKNFGRGILYSLCSMTDTLSKEMYRNRLA